MEMSFKYLVECDICERKEESNSHLPDNWRKLSGIGDMCPACHKEFQEWREKKKNKKDK